MIRTIVRTTSIVLICAAAMHALAGMAADYQINIEGARHLMDVPSKVPTPTRVEVYRFGPKLGLDSGKVRLPALRGQPEYSTTNETEIVNLMSAFRTQDNRFRIENMSLQRGYTYLLGLFQETNRTVIKVRIFVPTQHQTNSCAILPCDDVGSVYYSPKVGQWLSSRPRTATNPVPVLPPSSTNGLTQ